MQKYSIWKIKNIHSRLVNVVRVYCLVLEMNDMKVCQSDMYLQWKTKVHHEKDDLMKIH